MSECDCESSIMRRPWPHWGGGLRHGKNISPVGTKFSMWTDRWTDMNKLIVGIQIAIMPKAGFEKYSVLLCGNKMPTRCNR